MHLLPVLRSSKFKTLKRKYEKAKCILHSGLDSIFYFV
jgi:hypothetical protein